MPSRTDASLLLEIGQEAARFADQEAAKLARLEPGLKGDEVPAEGLLEHLAAPGFARAATLGAIRVRGWRWLAAFASKAGSVKALLAEVRAQQAQSMAAVLNKKESRFARVFAQYAWEHLEVMAATVAARMGTEGLKALVAPILGKKGP